MTKYETSDGGERSDAAVILADDEVVRAVDLVLAAVYSVDVSDHYVLVPAYEVA